MKFIIAFLFLLQLIIGGIVGITSFRFYHVDQLLFAETTDIDLVFDDIDQYHDFLAFAADKDITISRRIFVDFDRILLFTTDFTFGGTLALTEGEWPTYNSNEFISNVVHDDLNQVGQVRNTFPDFELIIRYLDEPQDFGIDGTYRLHTIDYLVLEEIERFLMDNVSSMDMHPSVVADTGVINFLINGAFNTGTITGTILAIFIPVVTFICLVASLIQYSMDQLKTSSILFFHGFAETKIIKRALMGLVKPLIISIILAYLGILTYLFIADFGVFLFSLTSYFVAMSGLLLLVYILIIVLTLAIILKSFGSYVAIKGYKPDFMIQILNHLLKSVFITCFLIASHFSFVHLNDLNTRRTELDHWEVARDVYRIPITHFWFHDDDLSLEQTANMIQFYDHLSENYQGFLMNSEWVGFYEDVGITAMIREGVDAPPFEINPYGNRIDISLNYLELNPINTINQIPIYEQIIWDNHVLNLLVPIHLSNYEDEIDELYLEHFYFQGISLANAYNEELGLPLVETMKDDLVLNIIYVEDNQYYFTFNPHVSLETGNRIKDPIAVIHTGSLHFTYVSSIKSTGLYFITDSLHPYSEIESFLIEKDLSYSIRFVYSVFAAKGDVIADLGADIARSLVIVLSLVLTNIIVSYNLIANYFWRHKYILFTKRLFGFGLLKRNKWFVMTFLGYLIPLIVIVSLVFGVNILIIGSLFLIAELVVMLILERRLQEKSFASIVKGEH